MEALNSADGSFRYIKGVFQYSGGVAANQGYEIVRVRFRSPIALSKGFEEIGRHLKEQGRPLASFCACELRSPKPFTDETFQQFNTEYVGTLGRWGIYRDGDNPVARSNVCPAINPPPEPSFHAYSYVRPTERQRPTFVVSGSGEVPEGMSNYRDHIVRRGDTSAAAMQEKARFVMTAMETRLGVLGFGWSDTTETQVYTVQDFHPFHAKEIIERGAASSGIHWYFARPPVVDLEFEVDCRSIATELII